MEEERKREKKRAAVHVYGCNVNVYVCRQLATPSSVSGGRGLACCVGEVLVDLNWAELGLFTYKMNLDSVPSEEKLKTCKRYFIIGCFGLPFVWLINGIWFLREAFFVKSEVTTRIRRYVLGSLLGALIWIALFVMWTSIYQTQRRNWGKSGIYISFVLPGGVP